MIVLLYKGKGERTECSTYRGINSLILVGKIFAGILLDRVHKGTEGLIDDEHGGFRTRRRCLYQIFILKQKGEKVREKKCSVYVMIMDLEKAYVGLIGKYYGRYLECGW